MKLKKSRSKLSMQNGSILSIRHLVVFGMEISDKQCKFIINIIIIFEHEMSPVRDDVE